MDVKLNLEDVRTLLTRLHHIARELNKPFDDGLLLSMIKDMAVLMSRYVQQ